MSLHVHKKPVATNPAPEVRWDSSPPVSTWRNAILAQVPKAKRAAWQAQLARLSDPRRVAPGQMGLGGVTTDPPLSLHAFQTDPDFWTGEICRIAAATHRTVDFVARAMECRHARVA